MFRLHFSLRNNRGDSSWHLFRRCFSNTNSEQMERAPSKRETHDTVVWLGIPGRDDGRNVDFWKHMHGLKNGGFRKCGLLSDVIVIVKQFDSGPGLCTHKTNSQTCRLPTEKADSFMCNQEAAFGRHQLRWNEAIVQMIMDRT